MDVFFQAPATFTLIITNVLVSILAFSNLKLFEDNALVVGEVVQNRQIHRIVTSGFLHVSPMHLFVNMLTLYFFGPYLESGGMLGLTGFLLVYFGALLAGSLWAILENIDRPEYAAVGASGAVSGVVIAFCLFEPFAMLYIFFLLPMPAILFAVLYIGFSAFLSGNPNSRIGHEAHLGGAVAGLVITMLLTPGILDSTLRQVLGRFG